MAFSSSFILITLFSLALVASITEARIAPGEYKNWQGVNKDEAVMEAVEHFTDEASRSLSGGHDAGSNNRALLKDLVRNFEPRSTFWIYRNDANLKGDTTFMKDFEPRSNLSAYPEEDAGLKAEKEFVKDFEPRPNASVYQD